MSAHSNLISLASGVVPEFGPFETIAAASQAGYDAVGLWVEPAEWTQSTTAAVRRQLDDTGLPVLDVEAVWIKPGDFDTDHLRILDVGMEIGARNVLVVSSDPDHAATEAKFAALCDHASSSAMRVALEFGMFTDVKTIGQALAIINAVDHPAAALLVDPIHLDRSGGRPEDVAKVTPSLLPYAQLCDARKCDFDINDLDSVIIDAIDERMQLGEGCLPLAETISALPASIAFSIELRSKHLRDTYPDAAERASAVIKATKHFLANGI